MSSKENNRLLVLGAGELGGRVARLYSGQVLALTQTSKRHGELNRPHIQPSTDPIEAHLDSDDCLLFSLPGFERQRTAIERLINNRLPAPARAILISSTGYYHPAAGLISAQRPAGSSERAQKIAQCEQMFMEWTAGDGIVIRFGGLYHAGRGPYAALARRKTLPSRGLDGRLLLMHYDDAASCVISVFEQARPKPHYLPLILPAPTRFEFYLAAATQLAKQEPDTYHSLLDQVRSAVRVSITQAVDTVDYQSDLPDLLPEPQYPDWQAALA